MDKRGKIADIARRFDEIEFLVTNNNFKPRNTAFEKRVDAIFSKGLNSRIQAVFGDLDHPNRKYFFERFDYSWAKDTSNFRNSFEHHFQLVLLDTLAEVAPDHPNYDRFGGICVRRVSSSAMNAELLRDGEFKYICVSHAYLAYIKEYLLAFQGVVDVGRKELASNQGHFHSEAELLSAAMSRQPEKCQKEVLRLNLSALQLAQGMPPTSLTKPMTSLKELREGNYSLSMQQAEYGRRLMAVDTFLILHELGHIAEEGSFSEARSINFEANADRAAGSFFVIAASRNPEMVMQYCDGTALMFNIFIHFDLVRKVVLAKQNSKIENFEKHFNLGYQELSARSLTFGKNIDRYGPLPQGTQSYFQRSRDYFQIIELTKSYLLENLKPLP